MADEQTEPKRRPAGRASWARWPALGCILLAGLLLRVLYFRELVDKPDFAAPAIDAGFHDYWARALATGAWTPPTGQPDPGIRETPFLRPPGYPYFLSLVYRLAGSGYAGPRVVQMGLGLLNCLLAFLFARRWYGWGVGLLVAAMMSVYWAFIYFEGELHAPALLITLLLATVHLLGRWTVRMTFLGALATGLLLGLAALVRPNVLLFVPVVLAWAGWMARRRRSWPRFCRAGAGLVVGTVVAVAPATVRNYAVASDFVLISSNTGINLFMGNNPSADGGVIDYIPGVGPFRTCYDYPALVENLEQQHRRKLRASEVSAYFRARAVRWIKEHPLDFLRLTAWKAYLFWGPREGAHNKVIRCERQFSSVLGTLPGNFFFILGASVLGVALLAGDLRPGAKSQRATPAALTRRREISVLLILLVLAFFLSILPFFISGRYRVPMIPLLLVFAAYGLFRVGQMALRRTDRTTALLATVWLVLAALVGRAAPLSAAETAKWHRDRARAYFRLEQAEAVIDELTEAVRLEPNDADAHLGLGIALAAQGRFADAVREFHTVLGINPDHPQARRLLTAARARLGRSDPSN